MTKITEAAARKACKLANDVARERGGIPDWVERDLGRSDSLMALARVLQEHSDVAKDVQAAIRSAYADEPTSYAHAYANTLCGLILPDEPDALDKFAKWLNVCSKDGKKLQEAAAMFGLKIVEAGDD